MQRSLAVIGSVLLALAAAAPAALAEDAPAATEQQAEPQPLPLSPVLGKEDAPVTIYEYSSLTCSHCAEFHTKTMPEIKKAYIDTGKVKLIIRDNPLDRFALQGAAIAHSLPEERYFAFVDLLYKQQAVWASAADPIKAISQYARLAGLNQDKIDAALKDETLANQIVATENEGQKRFNISGTPSFVFNDGAEVIRGAAEFKDFAAVIDKLLAQKK